MGAAPLRFRSRRGWFPPGEARSLCRVLPVQTCVKSTVGMRGLEKGGRRMSEGGVTHVILTLDWGPQSELCLTESQILAVQPALSARRRKR